MAVVSWVVPRVALVVCLVTLEGLYIRRSVALGGCLSLGSSTAVSVECLEVERIRRGCGTAAWDF